MGEPAGPHEPRARRIVRLVPHGCDNAYASIFYVTTGLHGLHVLLGLLINLVVQAKGYARRLAPSHDITVEVFSLYWHFVDVVWIFVFSSLYLAPHFA